MSRTRNISPGFFKNEQLAGLPPLTRIAFIGLWTEADREGKVNDRAKRLKAMILPYDRCDFNKIVQQLHDAGFLKRYEFGGERYIIINNFLRYQKPNPREAQSIIPSPPEHNLESAPSIIKNMPEHNQEHAEECLNLTSYSNSYLSKSKQTINNPKPPPAREGNGKSASSAKNKFTGFNLTDAQLALMANRLGIDHPLAKSLIAQLEGEIKEGLHKGPDTDNIKGVFAWVSKALESRHREYLQRQQPVTVSDDDPPPMGFGG